MKVNVYFTDSELNHSDFELDLRLFKKSLECFLKLSHISNMKVTIFKGACCETQKEEACHKSVCKQRRNKTVNASKSS